MFVSDTSSKLMGVKLKVVNSEGQVWTGNVDPQTSVGHFKRQILRSMYPEETTLGSANFRMGFPRESRNLKSQHSIEEERLKDNDVLMLVRNRASVGDNDKMLMDPTRAPSVNDIIEATKDLVASTPSSSSSPSPLAAATSSGRLLSTRDLSVETEQDREEPIIDFQSELKMIIGSLISVMAVLLHNNSDVQIICQQVQGRLKRRFDALKSGEGGANIPSVPLECTPMGIVRALNELRKLEFHPNSAALTALKEMGFEEDQATDALRICKNNREAAAELLRSGKKAEDYEAVLDPKGHLFNSLVSAPAIRLGLSNPKTLVAFLNILESPSTANLWLNDVDTAPVLTSIFKIYHAEKHAVP